MAQAMRTRTGQRVLAPALLCLGALLAGSGPLLGQDRPITVKLATLAPRGSAWHAHLQDMGAAWSEATDGRVTLRIYPGGVAGEEPDVLRKIRIGQLHAGALSLAGLQRISPAVNVLAIPMLMEGREDLARVRAAMEPRIEALLEERGYVLLQWGDVGWVRFFLNTAEHRPDDVRERKVLSWSDDSMSRLWRENGFHPVVLNQADVLSGLQTGLIDAIGSTPLFMLANQWFPFVPYMVEMPWIPLVGATLIDARVWERIPPELRPELLRIAREAGGLIQEEIYQLEADAISAMEARGLQVIRPTPQVVQEWRDLFRTGYSSLRGELIPPEWFDEAVRVADSVRTR